jgi:3-oxoacyl-[acyl-carrier protein] reductase
MSFADESSTEPGGFRIGLNINNIGGRVKGNYQVSCLNLQNQVHSIKFLIIREGNMLDLRDRVAVITGASRGIGSAASVLMAKAGADVAVLYSKDRNAALTTCSKIQAHGRSAVAIRCRVENYSECRSALSRVSRELGRIDILVNSAGIWEEGMIGSMTSRHWNRTLAINLTGTFNMCNLVVPKMKAQKFGRIVNLSSTAGQRGEPEHSAYAASKGGIIAFTKSIAVELIRYGIRVNCVAPGWVRTDMVAHVMRSKKLERAILSQIPRGTIGSAAEVAGSVIFLASGLAEHVVGEVLNVNGGSVLCG